MLIKYKGKYKVKYKQPRRGSASGDRQTDRQDVLRQQCNIQYNIKIQNEVKSSPAKKKHQDHHRLPVSTYHSRSVYLELRGLSGARDEKPIRNVVDVHKPTAGLAHKHSKSAPRRKRRRRAER